MKLLLMIAFLTFLPFYVQANDSAVETSAGGLKLRKEHSVLMEKERLFISKKLVRVEYEFRNTTNEAIVSEVAFPIPPIAFEVSNINESPDFSDFKAWIDDTPIQVEKEARAFVKNRDVTEDLVTAGLSIDSFGYIEQDDYNKEIMALKSDVRKNLIRIGALTSSTTDDGSLNFQPEWTTEIKYHWRQVFPPGKVVRIKHEYRPVTGYRPVQIQNFIKQFKDSCINTKTFNEVKKRVAKGMKNNPGYNNYFGAGWVSYILTTANTWQTPIKDFELIVQGEKGDLVSFCWDGPVEKTGDAQFRAHKTNFVPVNNVNFYFLDNHNFE